MRLLSLEREIDEFKIKTVEPPSYSPTFSMNPKRWGTPASVLLMENQKPISKRWSTRGSPILV